MVSSKPKILVVDDEPNVLLTMAAILRQEGYEVDEAEGGAIALAALERATYDLVLTDLNMPVVDGMAVLEAVQKHAPATVTVVITGYSSVHTALRALKLGAYEYLLKPTEIEDLKQAVRRSLERKHLSEIDTLYRVARSISGATDVATICATVADAVRGVLHLRHAYVVVPGADGCEPQIAKLLAVPEFRTHLEKGAVLTTESSTPLRDAAKAIGLSSIAVIPGITAGRLACMIVADDNGQCFDFHASTLRFLQGLASQTALAVENASLIAELRRSNQELAAVNDKLRELDRLKSQFLSVATHELRTPLSIILGYNSMLAESLADRLTGEEQTNFSEAIAACQRLIRLVNSMLDIAQIEAGRVSMRFEPHDLRQLVQSVGAFFAQEARRRRVSLHTDVSIRLPQVEADNERIQQVLINLIGNALKFTPSGGRVTVGVRAVAKDRVEIEVADTGPGIATEDQPLLFHEFGRVGRRTASQGAGLGLAITRRIVEAHGGTVRVHSKLGKGARFVVSLPTARDTAKAERSAVSA
jgi:signal transduction histidine kinase